MSNKVSVTFTGDMTKLQQVVEKSMNTIRGFGNDAKNAFVDLSAKVFLAEKAFHALDAVMGAPLKKARDFEDTRIAFRRFVGDAELAESILGRLKEFSVKTPFEPDDLFATAQGLLGAGVAADEVLGVVENLAAVAKDGRQLVELGDAMAKGFAKGKFQTEELNKFLERGINLNKGLQEITGKTGKEFEKAKEKGLGFNDVNRALAQMSEEGGLFFGLLEERSQSSSGLLSTIAGLLTEVQVRLGEPINDALRPVLTAAIDQLEQLLPRAEEVGRSIVDLFSAGAGAVEIVAAGASQLYAVLVPLMPLLVGLVAVWTAKRVAATLSLASINTHIRSVQAQLLALRLASVSAGGGFRGLQASAAVAFSSIRAQVMALSATIKAAFSATAIGAAITVATELFVRELAEAQRSITASKTELRAQRSFNRLERDLLAQRGQVDSDKEKEDLRKRLQDALENEEDSFQDRLMDTEDEADKERLKQGHRIRMFILKDMLQTLDQKTAAQIREGDAARESAAAAEQKAAAERKVQAELKRSREELEKLLDKQLEKESEERLEKKSFGDQKKELLGRAGVSSERDFMSELNRMSGQLKVGTLPDGEVAKLQKFLEVRRALRAVNEKEVEQEQRRKKSTADYAERVKLLEAEISGNKERLEQLRKEARIRELMEQFKQDGVSDAEALKRAKKLAGLETAAAGKEDVRDPGRSVIADSLARIGAGGRAFVVDNRVLSESQKQSRYQERIAKATEKTAEQETGGTVTAVFA